MRRVPIKTICAFLLLILSIVQSPGAPAAVSQADAVVSEKRELRTLPGQLDSVPVFNSNSPEVIQSEGILLSTLPQQRNHPEAHLNYPFRGRFDLFFHHISNGVLTGSKRTVYVGLLANNPSSHKVTLNVLAAASYLSQPDAPFIKLPNASDNTAGDVYAGPGDRVMSDFLHGQRQSSWPSKIVIPAKTTALIAALPIPVANLEPPINGRSGLLELSCPSPLYLTSVALFAKNTDGVEHAPDLSEWQAAVANDGLATPRERTATPQGTASSVVYGRVAGVARGSTWRATVTDGPESQYLSLKLGDRLSYPISSVERGTFGTGQVQSAPLLVRYPDTAYQAHGNYGVHYQLEIPIHNVADMEGVVTVHLQTPLKSDEKIDELKFFDTPPTRVFFRGTVRVRYLDDDAKEVDKYIHFVQDRGERNGILAQFLLKANEKRTIKIDLFYPPDATPPQVLTIKSNPLIY